TGGAGYIGSHTCVELLNAGHEVTVFDNFSNSQPEALARVERITGSGSQRRGIDGRERIPRHGRECGTDRRCRRARRIELTARRDRGHEHARRRGPERPRHKEVRIAVQHEHRCAARRIAHLSLGGRAAIVAPPAGRREAIVPTRRETQRAAQRTEDEPRVLVRCGGDEHRAGASAGFDDGAQRVVLRRRIDGARPRRAHE
ncbi:MAG: NAD-dependent epimerase/dehydratase family protein, partial [Gemmatimonadaceae bacterium]|nr:NAD-dependent epimerase/dehydratase family protein [Gemmatimonadaceae bacterium]